MPIERRINALEKSIGLGEEDTRLIVLDRKGTRVVIFRAVKPGTEGQRELVGRKPSLEEIDAAIQEHQREYGERPATLLSWNGSSFV